MASVMSFSQQQQQQQQQNLPIQTVNSSSTSVDGDLLTALAAYVTSGAHARSATQQEIQDLASEALSKPGGRAHLESLVSCDPYPEHKIWKHSAPAHGTIDISKTRIALTLGILSPDPVFDASGTGFFVAFSSSLNNGIFYYDELDLFTPGKASFKLTVTNLDFFVDIYRDQNRIGNFWFRNPGFLLPTGGLQLVGKIGVSIESS
ncbi:hypothetical protein BHE90_014292 [Fusarium euwallaceae]|uniref:Uncharacterized protein n=3 Tax=Fusarium solani species complex TaxID=232080 RepID=A0A430L6G3_9HYPO|nr:hypothetical protein CEP51_015175 [Fusarium floridanum]RSL84614.1 hypothetical protein CDV31_016681 [Fusarium ambrosium]RTE71308.1 hypothetical protein BHE90_014292 [Fusarium euwallaceae]